MTVSPLQPSRKTGSRSLGDLARDPNVTEKEKIAEASRQFEAIMLRQILGQARKPVFRSEWNKATATSGIYDDMVTTQLAENISRSGALGLAKSLETQLSPRAAKPVKTDAAAKTLPVTEESSRVVPAQGCST